MIRATFKRIGTTAMIAIMASLLAAQEGDVSDAASQGAVPPLVAFNGTVNQPDGKPFTGAVGLTFRFYKDQQGGGPLWTETQMVEADQSGHYRVSLGSTSSTGLPSDIFVAGEPRWLGVQADGQAEQPRVFLFSVPYALKSGDAEMLGGKPASAYLTAASPGLAASASTERLGSAAHVAATGVTSAATTSGTGTTDFVPLWTSSTNLGNSILFQSSSSDVGIGTQTPGAKLDIAGSEKVEGTLLLPGTGAATATAGKNSQPLNLAASAFNSGTASANNETFSWQAEPIGNNTSSPSATLNLRFGAGSATPTETGLAISNKGLISFAPGQTFPVVAGNETVSGNLTAGGSVSGASASFAGNLTTGSQTVNGSITATGTIAGHTANFTDNNSSEIVSVTQNGSGGALTASTGSSIAGTAAITGTATAASFAGRGVVGIDASSAGAGVVGQVTSATSLGSGVFGITASPNGVGVTGTGPSVGVIGNATATTGNAIGVEGTSTSGGGFGVEGTSSGPGGAGVHGKASAVFAAGVLGEALSGDATGVIGRGLGEGVAGVATNTTGPTIGVSGTSSSPCGVGVQGTNTGGGFAGQFTAQNQLGLMVNGPFSGVGSGIDLLATGGGTKWEILSTGQTSAQGANKLNIRDVSTGADVLTLDGNTGNVGIGNTAPQAKLDINGAGSSGFGIATQSNVQQARTMGGWVKAMAFVDPTLSSGQIARCFNSQLTGSAASTPPCGIGFRVDVGGNYTLDFGFEVDDRFPFAIATSVPFIPLTINICSRSLPGGQCSVTSNTQLSVFILQEGVNVDAPFYIAIF